MHWEAKLSTTDLEMLAKLDDKDQEKIKYFLKLLLEQIKYKDTKRQIISRRREIGKGQTLSHQDIWKAVNV